MGFDPNYTIMDRSDAESLLTDVIKDLDPQFLKFKNNPKAKVISNLISLARNTCQSLDDVVMDFYPYFREHITEFAQFSKTYTERKKQQQVADFDDLLVYWLKILQTQEEVAPLLPGTLPAHPGRRISGYQPDPGPNHRPDWSPRPDHGGG